MSVSSKRLRSSPPQCDSILGCAHFQIRFLPPSDIPNRSWRRRRRTDNAATEPLNIATRDKLSFNSGSEFIVDGEMETAIWGRVALSPKHVFNPRPGERNPFCIGACASGGCAPIPVFAAVLGRGSGGVMDKPIIEKATPGRESEFDLRKSRKTSPPYRVILHNDNFNRREYVVQVLMKVIPGMTLDNAVNIMQEAHYNGLSVVIICSQADAEEHCMQLRNNGLLSSIEPATGGC